MDDSCNDKKILGSKDSKKDFFHGVFMGEEHNVSEADKNSASASDGIEK